MRREIPHTSMAPLHIEEPSPYAAPDSDDPAGLPRVVFDRALWAPVALVVLVGAVMMTMAKVIRYGRSEVDRSGASIAAALAD